MIYSSFFFDKTGKHTYRTGITEEEVSDLQKNLQDLKSFMNEIDYILMLRENIYDCLKCFDAITFSDDYNFVSINRHMMNWLNSFYVWIEHHEKNYNVIFSSLKSKYYDSSFEYRLAYGLRRYTVHQGLGVTILLLDLLNEKMTFPICIEDLVKCKKVNRKLREELSKMIDEDNTVDAFAFVKAFLVIIEKFQEEMWNEMKSSIENTVYSILEYVKHDGLYVYESYISTEKDDLWLPVGDLLVRCSKKKKKIHIPTKLKEYIDSANNSSEMTHS